MIATSELFNCGLACSVSCGVLLSVQKRRTVKIRISVLLHADFQPHPPNVYNTREFEAKVLVLQQTYLSLVRLACLQPVLLAFFSLLVGRATVLNWNGKI